MLGFPINLVQLLGTGRGIFTSDDISGGTLVLNFVDRPDYTLKLDFLSETYEVWEEDSVVAGQVGYYQVKA